MQRRVILFEFVYSALRVDYKSVYFLRRGGVVLHTNGVYGRSARNHS